MLNELDCPAIPELAHDYKQLMAQWSNRTITAQLDIEICEISCKHRQCIEDFRWRPEPSIPAEYVRYRSMSPKDRDDFLEKNTSFFSRGKIYDYLEQRDRLIMINKNNLFTLISWFRLTGISQEARACIEPVLNSYSGKKTVESYNHKIMGLFYKTEMPAEVQKLLDSVGGTVVAELVQK